MGNKWRDCIVTYIDVIGTKKKHEPSRLMRDLHALVTKEKSQLASIDHVYTWNDSVLLLSFIKSSKVTYSAAMHDAEKLKKRIDCEVSESYAIAVKGQAFPSISPTSIDESETTGVTVSKASSWAMANCFAIERESSKGKWKKPWYVDIRIARQIQTSQCFEEKEVQMFASKGIKKSRKIRAFGGYL